MSAAQIIAAAPVHLYRWTVRPLLGGDCRFVPSCSDYALAAIERHGARRGSLLAIGRVFRCGPWCAGGHDPVPSPAGSTTGREAAASSSARL